VSNPYEALGVTDQQYRDAMNDPEINDAKIDLANRAAAYWKAIAPVGDPRTDPHSGAYRDSIHVEIGTDDVVRVVADTDYTYYIEYGSATVAEGAWRSKTEAHFAYEED
jgi:F420-0:gamma-glutamyl ligase-like protein